MLLQPFQRLLYFEDLLALAEYSMSTLLLKHCDSKFCQCLICIPSMDTQITVAQLVFLALLAYPKRFAWSQNYKSKFFHRELCAHSTQERLEVGSQEENSTKMHQNQRKRKISHSSIHFYLNSYHVPFLQFFCPYFTQFIVLFHWITAQNANPNTITKKNTGLLCPTNHFRTSDTLSNSHQPI